MRDDKLKKSRKKPSASAKKRRKSQPRSSSKGFRRPPTPKVQRSRVVSSVTTELGEETRAKLDELPQLFNVLKGEMSLVGPRPEMLWLVEEYEDWQLKRFTVPQGITGWWQVNGRSDKLMHEHTEEDLFYIKNYSLLLDLQILWRTIGAVFKRAGAY